MEDKEFIDSHPDATFIGVIQVGNRGVKRYYTDKVSYNKAYDKAWDSGLDMYAAILKDE